VRLAIITVVLAAAMAACGGGVTGADRVCGCSDLQCAQRAIQSPGTVDCGGWPDGGVANVDCAVNALDAGTPFAYRELLKGTEGGGQRLILLRDDGTSWLVNLNEAPVLPFGSTSTSIDAQQCRELTATRFPDNEAVLDCNGLGDPASPPCKR
jgi:hypothetical protein